MKNKKVLAIFAMAISLSCMMAGCGFLGTDEPEEQVVGGVTPTPEATKAPEATPTIAPNAQTTTYTSKDKTVSIDYPNATWSNKTDGDDMLSFESPDEGKILIIHGGEDDMSVAVLPTTEDMAVSLEQASDLVQGTDFEIQNYSATDVNGIGVYSYVTKMLNTEKSDGYAYVVNKVFANDQEFYSIAASVKTESALADVQKAVNSFKILGNSTLKEAAAGNSDNSGNASGEQTGESGGATGTDSGEAGTSGGATGIDSGTSSGDTGSSGDGGSSGGTVSSGGFTEEQLTDTNQTRTIYRNSDGHPLVIQPDGNGNWVDFDGNTYEFVNDEDVYDQDGVDYYYHGEAADVYYMPVYTDDYDEDYYE
ncbi:MAG: PsbP-related protein [Eubacteriales bacterium]|nr:PsbP-related protein [Eubacteriales bacterium]